MPVFVRTYYAFAGVRFRLNTCESIISADKHGRNIGLKPVHDPGAPIDRRVKHAKKSQEFLKNSSGAFRVGK